MEFNKRATELEAKMNKLRADIVYKDPAEQKSPPPVSESESVWFEDAFPAGAKPGVSGHPLTYAKAPEPVFSGAASLKRSGPGRAQDYYETGAAPLTVPAGAKFFVYVYLDPKSLPKEVMIQFYTGQWSHRAYWGQNVIPWG